MHAADSQGPSKRHTFECEPEHGFEQTPEMEATLTVAQHAPTTRLDPVNAGEDRPWPSRGDEFEGSRSLSAAVLWQPSLVTCTKSKPKQPSSLALEVCQNFTSEHYWQPDSDAHPPQPRGSVKLLGQLQVLVPASTGSHQQDPNGGLPKIRASASWEGFMASLPWGSLGGPFEGPAPESNGPQRQQSKPRHRNHPWSPTWSL